MEPNAMHRTTRLRPKHTPKHGAFEHQGLGSGSTDFVSLLTRDAAGHALGAIGEAILFFEL